MFKILDIKSVVILGTGCNASYFEKVERIKKWEGQHAGIEEVSAVFLIFLKEYNLRKVASVKHVK